MQDIKISESYPGNILLVIFDCILQVSIDMQSKLGQSL